MLQGTVGLLISHFVWAHLTEKLLSLHCLLCSAAVPSARTMPFRSFGRRAMRRECTCCAGAALTTATSSWPSPATRYLCSACLCPREGVCSPYAHFYWVTQDVSYMVRLKANLVLPVVVIKWYADIIIQYIYYWQNIEIQTKQCEGTPFY